MINTKWSEEDQMFVTTLPDVPSAPPFKSRYLLWSQAHAYQWLAETLYKVKVLTSIPD